MTKTMIRIILVTLLLVACSSAPVLADGGGPLPPFCPNGGTNCVN